MNNESEKQPFVMTECNYDSDKWLKACDKIIDLKNLDTTTSGLNVVGPLALLLEIKQIWLRAIGTENISTR